MVALKPSIKIWISQITSFPEFWVNIKNNKTTTYWWWFNGVEVPFQEICWKQNHHLDLFSQMQCFLITKQTQFHNHGLVEKGCISKISVLSFRVMFHWTMIMMGERVNKSFPTQKKWSFSFQPACCNSPFRSSKWRSLTSPSNPWKGHQPPKIIARFFE